MKGNLLFIQTEETPNPAAVKFFPGRMVMESGTLDFPNAQTAWRSDLVANLFAISGVAGVFLGSDFITVTKDAESDWVVLKPSILVTIMEYFMSHDRIVLKEAKIDHGPSHSSSEDDNVIKEIKELIETRVRPAVAQDGGDIIFDHYVDGIVYLRLQGSCSGCPSASATLKAGIENMLRHYIPEVQEVRAI